VADIQIRRASPAESDSVRALIQSVADETFAYIWGPKHVPIGDDDWSLAWVAISDAKVESTMKIVGAAGIVHAAKIVGVTMTRDDFVTDLWVLSEYRRQGIGQKLMAQAGFEIASRGYSKLRLRVVKSNTVAVNFYFGQGWQIAREFAHEKFGHAIYELSKSIG
jgi:ribosomal protein S18 acetylase RimI-like enzyme